MKKAYHDLTVRIVALAVAASLLIPPCGAGAPLAAQGYSLAPKSIFKEIDEQKKAQEEEARRNEDEQKAYWARKSTTVKAGIILLLSAFSNYVSGYTPGDLLPAPASISSPSAAVLPAAVTLSAAQEAALAEAIGAYVDRLPDNKKKDYAAGAYDININKRAAYEIGRIIFVQMVLRVPPAVPAGGQGLAYEYWTYDQKTGAAAPICLVMEPKSHNPYRTFYDDRLIPKYSSNNGASIFIATKEGLGNESGYMIVRMGDDGHFHVIDERYGLIEGKDYRFDASLGRVVFQDKAQREKTALPLDLLYDALKRGIASMPADLQDVYSAGYELDESGISRIGKKALLHVRVSKPDSRGDLGSAIWVYDTDTGRASPVRHEALLHRYPATYFFPRGYELVPRAVSASGSALYADVLSDDAKGYALIDIRDAGMCRLFEEKFGLAEGRDYVFDPIAGEIVYLKYDTVIKKCAVFDLIYAPGFPNTDVDGWLKNALSGTPSLYYAAQRGRVLFVAGVRQGQTIKEKLAVYDAGANRAEFVDIPGEEAIVEFMPPKISDDGRFGYAGYRTKSGSSGYVLVYVKAHMDRIGEAVVAKGEGREGVSHEFDAASGDLKILVPGSATGPAVMPVPAADLKAPPAVASGDTGLIGKAYEVTEITPAFEENKIVVAAVDTSSKMTETVSLDVTSRGPPARELLKAVVDAAPKMYRAVVEKLVRKLPKDITFATYATIQRDLFGFADPGGRIIALHDAIARDPVALFHELLEYLVVSGELMPAEVYAMIDGEGRKWLDDHQKKYADEGKSAYFLKNINHFYNRAFARQVFGDRDRNLTMAIKGLQIAADLDEKQRKTLFVGGQAAEKLSALALCCRDLENIFKLDVRRPIQRQKRNDVACQLAVRRESGVQVLDAVGRYMTGEMGFDFAQMEFGLKSKLMTIPYALSTGGIRSYDYWTEFLGRLRKRFGVGEWRDLDEGQCQRFATIAQNVARLGKKKGEPVSNAEKIFNDSITFTARTFGISDEDLRKGDADGGLPLDSKLQMMTVAYHMPYNKENLNAYRAAFAKVGELFALDTGMELPEAKGGMPLEAKMEIMAAIYELVIKKEMPLFDTSAREVIGKMFMLPPAELKALVKDGRLTVADRGRMVVAANRFAVSWHGEEIIQNTIASIERFFGVEEGRLLRAMRTGELPPEARAALLLAVHDISFGRKGPKTENTINGLAYEYLKDSAGGHAVSGLIAQSIDIPEPALWGGVMARSMADRKYEERRKSAETAKLKKKELAMIPDRAPARMIETVDRPVPAADEPKLIVESVVKKMEVKKPRAERKKREPKQDAADMRAAAEIRPEPPDASAQLVTLKTKAPAAKKTPPRREIDALGLTILTSRMTQRALDVYMRSLYPGKAIADLKPEIKKQLSIAAFNVARMKAEPALQKLLDLYRDTYAIDLSALKENEKKQLIVASYKIAFNGLDAGAPAVLAQIEELMPPAALKDVFAVSWMLLFLEKKQEEIVEELIVPVHEGRNILRIIQLFERQINVKRDDARAALEGQVATPVAPRAALSAEPEIAAERVFEIGAAKKLLRILVEKEMFRGEKDDAALDFFRALLNVSGREYPIALETLKECVAAGAVRKDELGEWIDLAGDIAAKDMGQSGENFYKPLQEVARQFASNKLPMVALGPEVIGRAVTRMKMADDVRRWFLGLQVVTRAALNARLEIAPRELAAMYEKLDAVYGLKPAVYALRYGVVTLRPFIDSRDALEVYANGLAALAAAAGDSADSLFKEELPELVRTASAGWIRDNWSRAVEAATADEGSGFRIGLMLRALALFADPYTIAEGPAVFYADICDAAAAAVKKGVYPATPRDRFLAYLWLKENGHPDLKWSDYNARFDELIALDRDMPGYFLGLFGGKGKAFGRAFDDENLLTAVSRKPAVRPSLNDDIGSSQKTDTAP
ncbi:MAG TPA: hypothetical protein P5287_00265 [bacterium]|nr:hypothetical protein [bacterium]